MLSRDFVGGLAAMVLGGLYLLFAFRQRVSALADSIGPAGIPKVLGFLMVAFGIILCLQGLYKQYTSPRTAAEQWQGQGKRMLRALGLVCFAVAYLALVRLLGYPLSIALLLAAVAIYLGAPLHWRIAVIAIGGACMLWALFVLLLDVPMPAGFLAQ